ncbi:4-demethylwyosine synthase TYW1, partial [Candidatus Micrarchaeota archaeon]|nr:4-demethylwyosine synthase TYW1 [Candidatus Micrarchaeota archaeon]
KTWRGGVDTPGEIVEESVYAQRKLLNGLPGFEKTVKSRWLEAQEPWHVAISLAGEPTMYPQIAEMIRHYHAHGMSTFLVTNGSFPNVLQELLDKNAMPTQLYLSLSAFDEESYKKTNVPMIENYWQRYNGSLDFLAKVKESNRTVLRMTLVNEWNFSHVKEYAALIKRGQPAYVEVKAFMAVGGARERIGVKGMPLLGQIRDFAKQLAKETGYIYCVEHAPSRVVLLCRDEKAQINRIIDFRAWARKFGVELKTGLDEQTNFPKVKKVSAKSGK